MEVLSKEELTQEIKNLRDLAANYRRTGDLKWDQGKKEASSEWHADAREAEDKASNLENKLQTLTAEEESSAAITQKAEVDYKDLAYRKAAELANTIKRHEKELAQSQRVGLESALKLLLPVMDNLSLALTNANESDNIVAGVRMTLQQFDVALTKLGVERVAVDGKFNPAIHEAVVTVESEGQDAGSIVSVLRAGYHVGDYLLRPALVTVAK
jgi:molecular chaperone GrpE